MISFSKLGAKGRFGNQLFQYGFLRTTAKRLGVKFYCPEWLGDSLFLLNDEDERAEEMGDVNKVYLEPKNYIGFNESALRIEDGTDILGYFQTEKYFDAKTVKKWYTFREENISSARERYKHIDFSKTVGIHLRFGENKSQPHYIIALIKYYADALSKVSHKENILVFSDEIKAAKWHLRAIKEKLIYIEGNKDYEDFYLMTLCHDFICSLSTFCWWAAWLNNYEDKIIVCPKEWLRPGYKVKNNDLAARGWISLKTCRFWIDNYKVVALRYALSKLSRPKGPPEISHWVTGANNLKLSTRSEYLRQLKYYLSKRQRFDDYILDKRNPAKACLDLKFAVYLQCFNQKKATFEALKSLRGFYPDVRVHLLSDRGEDFSEIADYFKCDYTYARENLAYWPCKNMIAWFERLYITCEMYKEAEWLVLMEDDVRVRDKISKYPNAHLAGQGGGMGLKEGARLSKSAKDYIWKLHPGLEINGYSGCGGSIFHIDSFKKCFKNIKEYDVERFKKLDARLSWATDISLTFLFLLNGFINRRWLDHSEESAGEWAYSPASSFDHKFKEYYDKPLTNEDLLLLKQR